MYTFNLFYFIFTSFISFLRKLIFSIETIPFSTSTTISSHNFDQFCILCSLATNGIDTRLVVNPMSSGRTYQISTLLETEQLTDVYSTLQGLWSPFQEYTCCNISNRKRFGSMYLIFKKRHTITNNLAVFFKKAFLILRIFNFKKSWYKCTNLMRKNFEFYAT